MTNVSGRGVGMDVVKTNVEKIGGTVDVQSAAGQGTTVRVKIPLTLAIIPALIVTCARRPLRDSAGEPCSSWSGWKRSKSARESNWFTARRSTGCAGDCCRSYTCARELRLDEDGGQRKESDEAVNIVVLQADGPPVRAVVDAINDTEEIVVKPLRKQLKSIKTFAGASIMGDGKIALILDVMGVAQRAGVRGRDARRGRSTRQLRRQRSRSAREKQTYPVVSRAPTRHGWPCRSIRSRGSRNCRRRRWKRPGTSWVAQYRGRILPLVNLAYALVQERRRRAATPGADEGAGKQAPLQVLVCNHEGHRVGLVVERIVDIVEDSAEVKYPASRAGHSVLGRDSGQVTELIDVPAILKAAQVCSSISNTRR